MKTAIVTDTNSGITPEEAKKEGIFLLPMPVVIDEKSYFEGVDIQSEQLLELMEKDCKVSTSQPSPDSIMKLWDSVLEQGYDSIVHIPMSSSLSGSCQTAIMLADEYDGKVTVVDNHRISVTQKEAALTAARMATDGSSAKEIREYLETTAYQANIYITVESLKYLQRGGRLSSSAAVLGTILNIKPILSIQGGQIEAFAKMRGLKKCEQKMIETIKNDIAERYIDVDPKKLKIATAGTLLLTEEIEHWKSTVQAAFPEMQVFYDALPCSVIAHVGPGCFGIAVFI